MPNKELQMTLEEAVGTVLANLTGLSLEYDPNYDRFRVITRALNRALRAVALEHEWSYFSSVEEVGTCVAGQQDVEINSSLRPRIVQDDAIRLNDADGHTLRWAYFIPRDALHKYVGRTGLWAAVTRTTITFSRQFVASENGLRIFVPVMREPKMFEIPEAGAEMPQRILRQPIDFDYPDLVIAKAQQFVAETDPVMQPRVQSLEAHYKDLMYQLVERDDRFTDSPYLNDFFVPMQGSLAGPDLMLHPHPHSDERRR